MIFFNSSMPRSMSTLLQCILNQNPEIAATQSDPVLEYLYGARTNFTNSPDSKALDSDLAMKTWLAFCKGGLESYAKAYTDKPNISIKARSGTSHYRWVENFMGEKPKMICMIRNLKSIFSSMEKLYRKYPNHHNQIQDQVKLTGTSTAKRIDAWLASAPIGLALERLQQTILEGINKDVLYIRAEDLTSYPQREMDKIYNYLGLKPFKHDFDNIEPVIKEDEAIYGVSNTLNTLKKRVQPLTPDYNEVLGKQVCDWIDANIAWYQQNFGYTR